MPNTFTAKHAQRLQAFADQAAVAIKNARLYHELTVYSGVLEQAVEERTSELRQTKERVEAILNHSPDPILLLKPNGAIESANPAFQQAFGCHVDELYLQPPFGLIAPDHIDALQDALQNALERAVGTRGVERVELIARRKDGTTFDVEAAMAPIVERDGDLLGVVCSLRDISLLMEVTRMKDAFVSNVSHELRTPISGLKLSHRLITLDPEKSATYLERMEREINRLNDLIEDLLRLSRLDQGGVVLDLKSVELNTLTSQFITEHTPLAESRELTLECEFSADQPTVQADEGLIGQVLSILLTNAFNYTPADGQVTVSTHSYQSDGKQWAGFRVSDTGPGIAPEDQRHIFERFYRGEAGHASGVPGTGLGLAIAHEIVARHQGRIEVTSDGVPGNGTTFTVWLPREE